VNVVITKDQAPALGDVRTMGTGDTILVRPNASQRKDWSRYLLAVTQAVARGADVHHTLQNGGE
jgi:hypothetical protein